MRTEAGLARLMVGRDVLLRVEKSRRDAGESRCSRSTDLHVLDERELEAVRGVSLQVRAGEIVGIAGVDGNGQTELVEALTGLRKIQSRQLLVAGRDLTRREHEPRSSTSGVGHIPEDRQRRGLVLEFTLAENIALHDFDREPQLAARLAASRTAARRGRRGSFMQFDVRGGGPKTRVRQSLSGGNQQKVVLAREMSNATRRVLIAAQPTRGLDVGAIEFVHRRLVEERDEARPSARVARAGGDPLALGPHPRHVRGRDRRRVRGPTSPRKSSAIAMRGGTRQPSRLA